MKAPSIPFIIALLSSQAMSDPGLREPGAQIDRLGDDQLMALVLVITRSGYHCGSVSSAGRSAWDGAYRVNCDGYRHSYDIRDVGGRWTATVR